MNIDFNNDNVVELVKNMHDTAQKLHEQAAELQSAWQDSKAGHVWEVLANGLERAANEVDNCWKNL